MSTRECLLACTLARGGFSGERVYSIPLTDGGHRQGLCSRNDTWDEHLSVQAPMPEEGQLLNGHVHARVLSVDGPTATVLLPGDAGTLFIPVTSLKDVPTPPEPLTHSHRLIACTLTGDAMSGHRRYVFQDADGRTIEDVCGKQHVRSKNFAPAPTIAEGEHIDGYLEVYVTDVDGEIARVAIPMENETVHVQVGRLLVIPRPASTLSAD